MASTRRGCKLLQMDSMSINVCDNCHGLPTNFYKLHSELQAFKINYSSLPSNYDITTMYLINLILSKRYIMFEYYLRQGLMFAVDFRELQYHSWLLQHKEKEGKTYSRGLYIAIPIVKFCFLTMMYVCESLILHS